MRSRPPAGSHIPLALLVLDDPRGKFPIDRSDEAVHILSYPPCGPTLAPSRGSMPLGFLEEEAIVTPRSEFASGPIVKGSLTNQSELCLLRSDEKRADRSNQAQESCRRAPAASTTRWTPSSPGSGIGWSRRRCAPRDSSRSSAAAGDQPGERVRIAEQFAQSRLVAARPGVPPKLPHGSPRSAARTEVREAGGSRPVRMPPLRRRAHREDEVFT